MSNVITRFAPSPTGYLHVGNIRTALIAYLYAKQKGGRFILRLDDTDLERSSKEYEQAIYEDLKWLGLEYDLSFKQSERITRYEEVRDRLIALGRIYPCYESQEELELKRKVLLSQGKPPLYDRASLKLSLDERLELERLGKRPHYRFLIANEDIRFTDHVRGEVHFAAANLSDPIIIRENGSMTYLLTSVVDDVDYKITHIIRGEDHVTNTAIQIQIFKLLQDFVPEFAHLALLTAKDGKISKRDGGFDVRTLKELGFEPMTILSLLARIGTSEQIQPFSNLQELSANFSIDHFGRAPATYEVEDLARLNHKIVSHYSYDEVSGRINARYGEEFFNKIKANLNKLSDIDLWWEILHNFLPTNRDDVSEGFIRAALEALPQGEWGEHSFKEWTHKLGEITGYKGKELFMPLRLALTGLNHGPEMKVLILLLGRLEVEKRLKGLLR